MFNGFSWLKRHVYYIGRLDGYPKKLKIIVSVGTNKNN